MRPLSLLLLLLLPSLALAQGAPERVERQVEAADGGLAMEESGALLPPVLEVESPALYPEGLRETPVEGTVQLQLLVGVDGRVEEVVLAEGVHPLLDAAAQEAARGLHFTPAQLEGVPVAVRLPYAYHFVAPAPAAPTGTLALEVRAKATRAKVTEAAVVDAQGNLLGQTDAEGRLTIQLPPGEHTLTVQAQGHHPATFTEKVEAGGALSVVYRLEPLQLDPYQTVVRGERVRTEVARTTLRAQELREVPGTLGDPFRVVMLMPGVASVASGISYPVVRGSQPAATGYFVDGVRVPVLFHLLLGPAVVHPSLVESMSFTPGLPSLRYGRLMAGAVEATLKRPNPEGVHGAASVDLINAGALVEGVLPGSGTEVTLGGRFSYTGWLLSALTEATGPTNPDGSRTRMVADFYDYQARLDQPVGPGRLRLLALGSSDVAGTDGAADMLLVTRFHRVDVRYRQPLAGGEGEVGLTLGTQGVGVESSFPTQQRNYLLLEDGLSLRASWQTQLAPSLFLSVGGDVERRMSRTDISAQTQAEDGGWQAVDVGLLPPAAHGLQTGAYAQLVWEPAANWSVAGGARVDGYHLAGGVQHASVDPRLTVRHALSEALTLKAGLGLVHQAPTVLLPLPVVDLSGLRYGLQEAVQVDAGAEWQPLPGWDVRVDGYFTRLTRAVEFDFERVLQLQRVGNRLLSGAATTGHAYGVELMVRRHLGGNWFGWVTYALQRSTRRQRFLRFDEAWQPTETVVADLPFAFDQTHVANASLSYKFPGNFTVGTTLHFHTGRPESGQLSSRTQVEGVDPVSGRAAWRAVDRDAVARLPSFWRVDLRAAKSWAFDDYAFELSLDLLNASLSREVLGYQYLTGPTLGDASDAPKKQPVELPVIAPMVGVKATF